MTRARFSVGRTTCTVFSMIKDRSIQIKNIYYMLTYAFQVLRQTNYEEISSENVDNVGDLFAAILSKGLAQQLKQGLYRTYITKPLHSNHSFLYTHYNPAHSGQVNRFLAFLQIILIDYIYFL